LTRKVQKKKVRGSRNITVEQIIQKGERKNEGLASQLKIGVKNEAQRKAKILNSWKNSQKKVMGGPRCAM